MIAPEGINEAKQGPRALLVRGAGTVLTMRR